MRQEKIYKQLIFNVIISLMLFSFVACEKSDEPVKNKTITSTISESITPVADDSPKNNNIIIENKSYLFNVTDHSIEELEALLIRAEEVSQAQSPDYDNLEIVMVIHGPDIDFFTQQNYAHNKELIDLAARLDAYDIIDMKVCETTMSMRGVEREDIPPFIESVPYAPTEIKDRLRDGYINL